MIENVLEYLKTHLFVNSYARIIAVAIILITVFAKVLLPDNLSLDPPDPT
ncbi:MAG: hypothetical protein ABII90_05485 [Bacteroidota bacterium]